MGGIILERELDKMGGGANRGREQRWRKNRVEGWN
jgi:hypothetical protein